MKTINSQAVFRIVYRIQIITLIFFVFETEAFSQNTKNVTKVRMSLN